MQQHTFSLENAHGDMTGVIYDDVVVLSVLLVCPKPRTITKNVINKSLKNRLQSIDRKVWLPRLYNIYSYVKGGYDFDSFFTFYFR